MKNSVVVKPLGWLAFLGDLLMFPLMWIIAGAPREKPQRTHHWNVMQLELDDIRDFDVHGMVECMPGETPIRDRKIRYHIPIFGGWREYVVLQPVEYQPDGWFVGWTAGEDFVTGASRIKVKGNVRMLLGPTAVNFFGVSAKDFRQIPIRLVGMGRVGDGGPYSKELLL